VRTQNRREGRVGERGVWVRTQEEEKRRESGRESV
jgi:hypothetical protein